MSRREEIKRKETFQLQFQQAIRQNNQKIAQWLKKPTSEPQKSSLEDLPIIEQGKGLNSAGAAVGNIGHFLSDDSMQKNGKASGKTQNSAMTSLLNKMRSDKRNKVQNTAITKPGSHRNGGKKAAKDVNGRPDIKHSQKQTQTMSNSQAYSSQQKKSMMYESQSEESEEETTSGGFTAKKPKLLF